MAKKKKKNKKPPLECRMCGRPEPAELDRYGDPLCTICWWQTRDEDDVKIDPDPEMLLRIKHINENAKSKIPGKRWRINADIGKKRLEIRDAGDFDEIVIDGLLHVERMSKRGWFVQVGDERMNVWITKKGKVKITDKGTDW